MLCTFARSMIKKKHISHIILYNKIKYDSLTIAVTWTYESSVSRIRQTPRGISKIIAGTIVASIPRVLTDSGKSIAALNLLMNIIVRVSDGNEREA